MVENFPSDETQPQRPYQGTKQAVWECIGGCPVRQKFNTNNEIAECTGFVPQGVGNICRELVQEGLLSEKRSSTRSRPRVRALTERGQELASQLPTIPCFLQGEGATESDRNAREGRWLLPTQQATLKAIRIVGGLTLWAGTTDVARRIGRDTGTVRAAAKKLAGKELVHIPEDRWASPLYVTPRGRAVANSLPDTVLPESWKPVELPPVDEFKPLIAETYPEEQREAVARSLAGFLHEELLTVDDEDGLSIGEILERHLAANEIYVLLLRFNLGDLVAPQGWDKAARDFMAKRGIKNYGSYATSLLNEIRQGRLGER